MAEFKATEEINSESHVALWLYAFDFFFILIYIFVSWFMLCNLVSTSFHVPFMIFSCVCAITLTIPSGFNKKRRMYQSLLIFLRRDKNVYHPLTGKEDLGGKEWH